MVRLAASLLLGFILVSPLRAEPEKPKLVVLIVFDQMRGDYPERWKTLFVEDGFARLQREGAWYVNCHYPYATTATGPGHASMFTGCSPDLHGIVGNSWYDAKAGEAAYCAGTPRYQRVPPLMKELPDSEEPKKETTPVSTKPKPQGTPDLILVPTLSDVLKAASPKSKIIGLSFKDRSAVLPTGKKADGVYWLDSSDGMIVTSTYYRDALPGWLNDFNRARLADSWFEREWKHFRDDLDYRKYSGPDDVEGEGKGSKQGIVFPHPMNAGVKKLSKAYFEALFNSPYGNDFLFELTKTAIKEEQLGQDEIPDLLVVSFSSNDAIGHTWGPDSQEVLDCTLRSDKMLGEFLKFLDQQVGKGKYLIGLTADHGICPLPEVSKAKGIDAKRISGVKLIAAAEEFLTQTYGKLEEETKPNAKKPKWIENVTFPWIYLNSRVIEAKSLKVDEVASKLTEFLRKQEGIERAYTRADLEAADSASDPFQVKMKRSYYAPRCGDVGLVGKPYCLFDDKTPATGTNHGSPHAYDTHVPLMFFGTGITPGTREDQVTPQAITPVFAQALGINPPKTAAYPVPKGLFKE
jgi:predicted AlkP superfamily pyrophosphatase or phosphodiesterase